MGRYFIHLAYNGANYNGWQTQPGLPTVQQTIETALSTLLRQPIAVVGCGRTDTGVHASDFYAHFTYTPALTGTPSNLEGELDCGQLVFKLNNLLPPDIAIYDIFLVADNAHARYDAMARTYQYHVSDRRLPFRQGQYCRIYFKPDIDKMNEAAKVLMEYDDFTSFAKLHTQVKTNICHLTQAEWSEIPVSYSSTTVERGCRTEPTAHHPSPKLGEELEWVFTIRSNRFLRNMVRSVTGTLLDVGRGKLTIEGLREIIEKKDRCAAGVSMPACGLFLTKVEYPYL
ncbi:MAG: tRNA pseudouridine(38-40) synthase TruA [bacterium]